MRRSLLVLVAVLAALLATTTSAAAAEEHECNGFAATIVGTDGPDRLVGTPNRDIIVGLAGKDVIFGGGGNDIICGGPGGDLIRGQGGRDWLFGNGGNDRLLGNIGKDKLDGGRGLDRLWGGGGPDTLDGGRAFDLVRGGNGNDTCQIGRDDLFEQSEGGNVAGFSSVGAATVEAAPPASFATHTATSDEETERYFAVSLVFKGQSDDSIHSVRFLDAGGSTLELIVGQGRAHSGQFLLRGDAASFEVNTDGWWDVAYMDHTAVSKLGREVVGNGSTVYYVDPVVGPGAFGDIFVAAGNSGRLVLSSFTPGSFADVKTNEALTGAELTRGGALAEGTYLIAVRVDKGLWELLITE
ncbi:MAG: calcium-binding protein [Acidimicrobiales bacterium]|nr:MAG: calcium-binding protein [Acidimicrobiales bacterium]